MHLQELVTNWPWAVDHHPHFRVERIKKIFSENPEQFKELNLEAGSKLLRGLLALDWWKGISEIVQFFFEVGAHCLTPLQRALLGSNLELLKSLLENKEKPEGPEWYVDSLIKCMFWKKNLNLRKDMLLLMLKHGLNTEFKNAKHENLLCIFVSQFVNKEDHDVIDTAEILIKSGNSVNEAGVDGWTPFIVSIHQNHLPLATLFIEKGANVESEYNVYIFEWDDYFYIYPLIFAAHFCTNNDLIMLLLSKVTDVNVKSRSDGWTALHRMSEVIAMDNSVEKIIDVLIRNGADVNSEDHSGKTPFSCMETFQPHYASGVKIMAKHFSKLLHADLFVSEKNMNLVETNPEARKYFDLCTTELNIMRKTIFHAPYSYYFVLNTAKKNIKKLAQLTKNEELVKNFEANVGAFSCYKSDLEMIFTEAMLVRDELLSIESYLYSIFKDIFPDTIIRKLADNLSVKDFPL